MNAHFTIVALLFCLIKFILTSTNLKSKENIQHVIDEIYTSLLKEQIVKEQSYRMFPPRFAENKGLFRSWIHLNFVDNKNSLWSTVVRRNAKVDDMNMFVTSFALSAIFEAWELDGISLDKESIRIALEGILDFKDKNMGDLPVYTFWKQKFQINGTWSQYPENMVNIIKHAPVVPSWVISLLNKTGLTELASNLNFYNAATKAFNEIYRIPSDADDTSINLGLTGLMHKFKNITGNLSDIWLEKNQKVEGLFNTYKRFAYRPFINTTEPHLNYTFQDVLDPRSYYVIGIFLSEQVEQGTSVDVILPSTWMSDLTIQRSIPDLINMPFNVNNVDLSVVCNFLFGLTNIVTFHPDRDYINKIFDSEMQKMYRSSVDLLVSSLKRNVIFERPDLALVYYPSVFDFYWLLSRVYSSLKNNQQLLHPILKESFGKLDDTLKKIATQQLLDNIVSRKNDQAYCDEFLGNGANYTRGEDRLFSTGLVLNALLDIWTHKVSANGIYHLTYDQEVPKEVPVIVEKLSNFVIANVNRWSTSKDNAFFSGSYKGYKSMAYFYPANYFVYLNGTVLDDITDLKKAYGGLTDGVQGYIPRQKYEEMKNQKYFGFDVPKTKQDFNSQPFPYWSSPAITYSINLLALSKYKQLIK